MKLRESEIIHQSFAIQEKFDPMSNQIFENWGKHHCQHCEHASMFPVKVTDLGSLKLKEILRF